MGEVPQSGGGSESNIKLAHPNKSVDNVRDEVTPAAMDNKAILVQVEVEV